MTRRAPRGLATIALALALPAPAASQVAREAVDLAVVSRIREEGLERSRVEELARHLTDVIGPRLTGSPGMRRANEWTAARLREWGASGVAVVPWGEFGRGWERVSYSGRFLRPFVQPLSAQPTAWTGSTRGTVRGPAVVVRAETPEELRELRGRLRGAFVLTEEPEVPGPEFEPRPLRRELDSLLAPPAPPGPEEEEEARRERERRRAELERSAELRRLRDSAFAAERIAAHFVPSSRPYGILRGGGSADGRVPGNPIPPPELVVSLEQYAQMWRNVEAGVPVELEVSVENRFYEEDLRAYNTFGDIPGSDLAGEYVMIGAHLDSWHFGTGATDNGAGSIVMLEAVRILRALGLQPRRTIRIGLWSGEEQGLLGSRAWLEANADLWPRISAYLNVDNGTGRIRGIWDQSNERAIPVFEQILWPFRDLGVVAVRHGDTGGTDHLSFDRVGIPGFNFIQDPIEYGARTHHTEADTFERLVLDDLRQAAVVVAATAWHLANRDELMPRKEASAASGS